MEKNNLSGILVGVCICIIIIGGVGFWKLNEALKTNKRETAALQEKLATKKEEMSKKVVSEKKIPEDVHLMVQDTQEALNRIEKNREEQKINPIKKIATTEETVDDSSRAWLEELKDELAELGQQELELMSVLADEKESLDPISKDLVAIEEQYEKIMGDEAGISSLNTKIEKLEKNLRDRDFELSRRNQMFTALENEKQDLEEQLDVLRQQANEKAVDNDLLRESVETLTQELEITKKDIVAKSSKKNMAGQVKELKGRVRSLENRRLLLEKKLGKNSTELETRLLALNKADLEKTKLGNTLNKLRSEMDKTSKLNIDLNKQVDSLTVSLEKAVKSQSFSGKNALNKKIEVLKERVKTLNNRKSDLEKTVEATKKENQILDKSLNDLLDDKTKLLEEKNKIFELNKDMEMKLSALADQLSVSKSKISELSRRDPGTKEIKRLQNIVNLLQAEKDKLELSFSDLRNEKEGAEDKVSELTSKVLSLQKDLLKERKKSDSSLELRNLRLALKDQKKKYEDLEKYADKLVAESKQLKDIEREKNELEKVVNKLQSQKNDLVEELSTVKDGKKELLQQVASMQDRLTELRKTKETQESSIAKLQTQIENPEKSDDKNVIVLQKKVDVQKEQLERVTVLYSRLKDQLKEVAVILAKRDEIISKRESQLTGLQQEREYLIKKVDFLEDFFNSFQQHQKATSEKLNVIGNAKGSADKEVDVILNSSTLEE